MLDQILNKIESDYQLSADELKLLLTLKEADEIKLLLEAAYKIKSNIIGKKVFYRGLIEISNICIKDCFYCGIRKSNSSVDRYLMKEDEILKSAEFAYKNNYGSIVLQSGERNDKQFVDFIERIIYKIKELSNEKLGITLSFGEQEEAVYKKWFEAGAHRYLLRIETSNENLYKKLHPLDHNYSKRKNCLKILKQAGYQVGTGIMIKLPFQTYDDLVNDILFFKEMDIDMIGMGPYIVSSNTPLAEENNYLIDEDVYTLSLKMIALVRIYLKDVNIASTTALQTLKTFGREMGLKAGANIIMPNVSETLYRSSYQLYDGKPCTDENAEDCVNCLESRILNIDEEIGYGEWGDSAHFKNKTRS
ncbi:MAG: biotin synthetase [Ignavibacteria bacterium]|nr:MAG: biotin synthetase [Ignavibacteria bacterium]KAF0161630.1 MAG: biotin synthetase [Ignavibacteria bacterium]